MKPSESGPKKPCGPKYPEFPGKWVKFPGKPRMKPKGGGIAG